MGGLPAVKTPRSALFLRRILHHYDNRPKARAIIAEAFKLASESDAGTGNAIGDLEVICVRYVAEIYADRTMAK